MADEFGCGEDLVQDDIEEEDIASLIIQQVEFCTTIILNKVDTVTPEQLAKVKAIIKTLQPKAKILETNYGKVPVSEILDTHRFDFDEASLSAGWVKELDAEVEENVHHEHKHEDDEHLEHDHDEHHHGHGHHHHHHDHDHEHGEEFGIGTFVYYRRVPFAKEKFENFINDMPKSIIRTKGIIWASENNTDAYMFEQSGRQINIVNAGQWVATAPPDVRENMMKEDPTLQRDWDDEIGDRMIKLVFIGQNMNEEDIVQTLDDCLAY